MPKKDYISGIHNYCDRWCERCKFTKRCAAFALEKMIEASGDPAQAFEAFWEEQHDDDEGPSVFDEIDFDELDLEPPQQVLDEMAARDFLADVDELSRSSMAYAKRGHAWLEKNAAEPDAVTKGAAPVRGLDAAADHKRIGEAVEIIGWYVFQVHVKLRRALHSDEELEEGLAADGFPRDSDGSAKVALIGMDRSIAAWGYLRQHLPSQRQVILEILLHLNHLRRRTERRFPNARAFKRPGFDD